jgi:transcriptional regulator with XRE-family HTH domain
VFSSLLSQRGYNPSSLASELDMPKTTIYKWKDGSSPMLDKLIPIADALGVTLDELAGRVPPQHTEQEIELLEMFSKMDAKQKQALLDYADYIVSR